MAARKTRLKGRNSLGSAEKPSKRGVKPAMKKETALTKRKSLISPGRKANAHSNSNHNQKTQSRKAKRVSSSSSTPKDEYDFDSSDDFVNGKPVLLSSSFTSSVKQARLCTFTSIISKSKSKVTSSKLQLGKQHNTSHRKLKNVDSKKTSTPLLSDSANHISSKKHGNMPWNHYLSCRVSIPKLDLDMTVTPILPVSTPGTTKQGKRRQQDTKTVSFVEDQQRQKPEMTPVQPVGKTDKQRKTKKTVFMSQGANTLDQKNLEKQPTPVLPMKNKQQKRKVGQFQRTTETTVTADVAPAKKRKTDPAPSIQMPAPTKQKRITPKSSKPPKKETAPSKEKPAPKPAKPCVTNKKPAKPQKPVTSTPVLPREEQGVWQPGKEKMYCTPQLYDSGISMGSSLSSSKETGSVLSLPGFMEDEPLLPMSDEFTTSPVPALDFKPASDPASMLNKSSSREYRPGKVKREKGRFSTSRVDAWASAVNQSLEDVESFELVVE